MSYMDSIPKWLPFAAVSIANLAHSACSSLVPYIIAAKTSSIPFSATKVVTWRKRNHSISLFLSRSSPRLNYFSPLSSYTPAYRTVASIQTTPVTLTFNSLLPIPFILLGLRCVEILSYRNTAFASFFAYNLRKLLYPLLQLPMSTLHEE
ncbi:hypothetical protein K445DRAFT_146330 [Daldinia sp. EC12]|nr:hypothetical protein K445DRAFT_146330 [Daldinia sp. EC12]